MAYSIIDKFIPASKYAIKAPYSMVPETVTIHNTWNDAAALSEVNYMTSNANQVSYHVAVDDKHAVQAIPFSRNAWHAGDGQGAGNRKSIGIEICYSKSGGPKYAAAEENAIDYVAHILNDRGWGMDRVKWHKDWSGKNCPHRILDEGRAATVRNRIAKRLQELKNGSVKPASTDRDYLIYGDRGDSVKALQKYLTEVGFPVEVSGYYNAATKKAVMKFQKVRGLEADGVYGKGSKTEMNKALKDQAAVKPATKPKEESTVAEQYKKDAQPSKSLAKEWEIAKKHKITDGSYPGKPATKEEVAAMIVRANDLK